MKKKPFKLITALLILVIMVGAYVGLTLYGPKEEDSSTEEETEDITAYTIDANNIAKIYVENNASKTPLTFAKDGENWYCEEAKECSLNQYKITAMLDAITEVEAEQKIDNGMEENKEEFGLDKPATTITITLTDDSQVTYYLGTLNSVLQQYYFNVKGQQDVYLISTVMYNSFDYDILGLAEFLEYPVLGNSDILEFDVTADGKTTYYKDKAEVANKKDETEIPESKWYTGNSPDNLKKADSETASNLIQEIIGLTSSSCISYKYTDKDLEKYGLTEDKAIKLHVAYTETHTSGDDADTEDDTDSTATPANQTDTTAAPEATASSEEHMVIEQKEFTIYIGKEDSGERYVRLEGQKQIDKMNLNSLENLLELAGQGQ